MTAFLIFGFAQVPAAPAALRAALPPVDASRPTGWVITPIRHWRTGNKAPELPPG